MLIAFNDTMAELYIFASEEEAIAHCQGIEIAEKEWLFFAEDGSPLRPIFSDPPRINMGNNTYHNGTYYLEPSAGEHVNLFLGKVAKVYGLGEIDSVEKIKDILDSNSTAPPLSDV